MSTVQTLQIKSADLEETLAIALRIGQNLKGGEVIELVSDLGGGKTSFVRGLAAGMGSIDTVHSPSFTINNQYKTESDLVLHHFDFYRLQEPGILRDELAEVLQDTRAVTAIEWADIIETVLPDERLSVRITPTGETDRTLQFTYPKTLRYLFPNNT